MNLPSPVKYGKGKVISTAADVLDGLAAGYPVAQHVLDYRQLTKLKGTYIDALPLLHSPRNRAPAHDLQSSRRRHRASLFLKSESAEHSHTYRRGARNPVRFRA